MLNLKNLILKNKIPEKEEDQLYMENVYKELLQHCFLWALSQTDFFKHAAFHGGTCLRIINKISRFSEDLDFISTTSNTTPSQYEDMFNEAVQILSDNNLPLEIAHKPVNNNVQKVWLREGIFAKEFLSENPKYVFQGAKSQIKIELDIKPPPGSQFQIAKIDFPGSFEVKIQDLTSSFSGKLHAIFCRDYFYNNPSYIKGRDYFDLDWYLSQNIEPNYALLKNALYLAGPFKDKEIIVNRTWVLENLKTKLTSLDWKLVHSDMKNFLLSMLYSELEEILNSDSMLQKTKSIFDTQK